MWAIAQELHKPHINHGSPQFTPRSWYDFELALSAALEARLTGRVPTPEEAAGKSLLWIQSVNLQTEWLKFYEDQLAEKDPFSQNGQQ